MPNSGLKLGSATVTPWGHLRVALEPTRQFIDTFDSAIDPNQWTLSNGGTGLLPAFSGASATLNSGTTLNSFSKMVSVPTFAAEEPAFLFFASRINFPFPIPVNAGYQAFGFFTSSATPTIASPIIDGVVFETGLNGKLVLASYAGGVRNPTLIDFTQALGLNPNVPAQAIDAAAHKYYIYFRPDFCIAALEDFDDITTAFTTGAPGPNVNNLPIQFLSISNGGTALTLINNGCSVGDYGRNNLTVSDGTYAWRKQKILLGGDLPANNAQGSYPQPTNIAYVATTDTPFLAANPSRRNVIISNDTTAKLYILIDPSGAAAASATNFDYVIQAGGTFEMPNPVSTARIRGFWAAGGAGSAGVTDISAATTIGGA